MVSFFDRLSLFLHPSPMVGLHAASVVELLFFLPKALVSSASSDKAEGISSSSLGEKGLQRWCLLCPLGCLDVKVVSKCSYQVVLQKQRII